MEQAQSYQMIPGVVFKQHSFNQTNQNNSEGVLLNLETGDYFTLNGTGCLIWKLLGTRESIEAIGKSLIEEFAESSECEIQADLKAFLSELAANRLLMV